MSPPRTSNDPRSRGTQPRGSTVPYTRHLTVMSGNSPVKSIKPISNSVVGRSVEVEDTAVLLALTGANGELLRVLAKETGAEISNRGNQILLSGTAEQVDLAERVLADSSALVSRGGQLTATDYSRGVQSIRTETMVSMREVYDEGIAIAGRGKSIIAKSFAQKRYLESIRTHDLTFGIGPAGTGKTYLAMAVAVHHLLERKVKRIILTRPAVEAGEKLGFLPGDLAEKVNPYLRPLYDALHDMMDFERAQNLITRGQIEVAPLAFMRGRTLTDSFVILDEAQNTTSPQMRMFLTRLGFGSRAVVTGDVTQIDLPTGVRSGLGEARHLLKDVPEIAICEFGDIDVVRHPLVQKIVQAYEKQDAERAAQKAAKELAKDQS